jgi:hypothetical protein
MADTKISALPASTTPLTGTELVPIVQGGVTKQVSIANLTAGRSLSSSGLTVTSAGDLGVNITTTGTANAGSLIITNGNGTTSAQYSYLRFVNSQTSPQDWRIGTYGTAALSIINATAGNVFASFDISGNFSMALNNIYFSTAAKGINFTANTPASGMTSQLLNWYEEGTWTPTLTGSSSNPTVTYDLQRALYTRVGRQVTVTCYLSWTAFSGGSGDVYVSGLPFTIESSKGTYAAAAIAQMDGVTYDASRTVPGLLGLAGSTSIRLQSYGSNVSTTKLSVGAIASSGSIVFTMSYFV